MIFVDGTDYLLKYYKDHTIDRAPTLLEEQEDAFM